MTQPVPNCCQCIIPWTQSGIRAWFVTLEELDGEDAVVIDGEDGQAILAETKGEH